MAQILDLAAARRARRRQIVADTLVAPALVTGARVRLARSRGDWIVDAPPDRGRVYLRLDGTAVMTFARLDEVAPIAPPAPHTEGPAA